MKAKIRSILEKKNRENPYWLPRHKRISGRIEFDAFLDVAQEEALRCTEEFERFQMLAYTCGSVIPKQEPKYRWLHDGTIELPERNTYQISFGHRPMRRRDLGGKWAVEEGATLHYSLGDGGHVATTLYGAESELGRMDEKMIFLRIGYYSGYQLKTFLKRDIRDLTSYMYVSSVDTEPTLRQRARVWFLRHFHPVQVDGKFEHAKGNKWVGSAADFTARTLLLVLLKPIGIAVAISVLAILGYEQLATAISP
jgi:hypothetical protein